VLVLRVYLINEKIGLEPKPNPPLALVPEQLKRLPNRRQSSKYEYDVKRNSKIEL
jgi:hypothetical protein